MIDLLDIKIQLKHTPFGNPRTIDDVENDVIKKKHLSTKCYVNDVPIIVTSLNKGKKICIRGCPLKPLQGHNIFGTNQVTKLGYKLITDVLADLGITASKAQLEAWRKGEFVIDEIHLTHRFPIYEGERIMQIVSHIHKYSSIALKPAIIKRGLGVELTAPHSHATWMFYDKGQEFLDKRMNEHSFLEQHVGVDAELARAELTEIARNSIRAELKLEKKYLKKHELNLGKEWTVDLVKDVYLEELSLLKLGSIPAIQQMPIIYQQIDDAKLRSVMVLWANGEDLNDQYKIGTYRKYRNIIREEFGIDIKFDTPVNKRARLQLSEIFDESMMLVGFPKALKREFPELAFK